MVVKIVVKLEYDNVLKVYEEYVNLVLDVDEFVVYLKMVIIKVE